MRTIWKTIALLCSLAVGGSCQTAGPKNESLQSKIKYASLSNSNLGLLLTKDGENRQGTFSLDDQTVLFVSKNRDHHSQAQLYSLSLDNFKEQRITYSDGDVEQPIYSSDGNSILYASNTDALKEHPELFYQQSVKQVPTFNLYESDLHGLQIQRLTNQEGYQGELSHVQWKLNEYTFLSQNNNMFLIQAITLPKKEIRTLYKKVMGIDDTKKIHSPILSPTKLLLWIETDTKTNLGSVQLKKGFGKEDTLPLSPAIYQSLSWWDADKEMVLFSAQFISENHAQGIYIYNIKEKCLITLVKDSLRLLDARVSHDKEKLLFTAVQSGKTQLFLKTVPDPLPACEKVNP